MVSLQSVFSHMTSNPSQPIPLHYNSGIFRVFEDYRNIREEKKRLDNLLHETFEGYRAAESFYDKAEAEYQAEIRRLELLIAHGTSGMSGVMKARRESTVERARTHRKTMSYDHTSTSVPAAFENFPTESLDEQIRMRSQQVLLRRPVSPSSKMTILFRCLENAQSVTDFAVGTPPAQEKVTLSRKVHSELNLARLGINCIDDSVPRSIDSGFSGNGDPLPDEVEPSPVMVEPAVDLEAFVALKELGTLVARKRGIDTDKFLTGLMQLYSMPPDNIEHKPKFGAPGQVITTSPFEPVGNTCKASSNMKDAVRQVRSQPPIGSVQRNRRHFSFEPGDDQAAALERQFKAHDTEGLIDSDEPGMAFDGQWD
ncbi:hypothetical protein SLS60_006153 [Paraconiothyrium brasiliense]|uniref:Uncharacterized protein n=1 Tax=Paraconiothyrium brasiliense TaxID=300254 RepID=A0ABR3REF0_9PLEO